MCIPRRVGFFCMVSPMRLRIASSGFSRNFIVLVDSKLVIVEELMDVISFLLDTIMIPEIEVRISESRANKSNVQNLTPNLRRKRENAVDESIVVVSVDLFFVGVLIFHTLSIMANGGMVKPIQCDRGFQHPSGPREDHEGPPCLH